MQSLFIIVLREIKADGRKMHSIFFLFYKKAKIIFLLFMYTNKRPFTIPIIFMTEELLPLLEGEYIQWLLQRRMRSFKYSTFTMQPVHYHYKKQPVKHMEKHTALFKYVVKSVLFSVIRYI